MTASVFASSEIANTSWSLLTYNGSGATGSLSFDQTTMSSKFCNNVNQTYSFTGNMLYSHGVWVSTMMYCEGLAMTLEHNFVIPSTGALALLSGNMLTIISHNNTYVFEKLQAFWEDFIVPGDKDLNSKMCTMEYNPVCGQKVVQCIKAPCDPIQQTYGNICTMNNDDAVFLYSGECMTQIVGNDKDNHGCIWSAGYSWSQSQKQCVRVREYQATDLQKAYDLAYNHGITTMNTVESFRADNEITRQEAAKMFVAVFQNLLWKTIPSDTQACSWIYKDESFFDLSLRPFVYQACTLGLMKWSKGNFLPDWNLTRGQTLAILMRAVDGWQDAEKHSTPWWMPYADRAYELKYLSFANFKGFEQPITRGEVVEWINTVYTSYVNRGTSQ